MLLHLALFPFLVLSSVIRVPDLDKLCEKLEGKIHAKWEQYYGTQQTYQDEISYYAKQVTVDGYVFKYKGTNVKEQRKGFSYTAIIHFYESDEIKGKLLKVVATFIPSGNRSGRLLQRLCYDPTEKSDKNV